MSIFILPRKPLLRRPTRDATLISTAIFLILFVNFLLQPIPRPPSSSSHLSREPPQKRALTSLARTETPSEANLAYFIQIAQSTAGHLPRLLARLYHTDNVYAIHFDSKMEADIVTDVTQRLYNENPMYRRNVHIMPSELITYRGISMVLNTINAMKFLLERNPRWHYFINLSGSDYPLISPRLQRQLLGKHVDREFNFVAFATKERWQDNIAHRLDHFYVDEALSFAEGPSEVKQMAQLNPLARAMRFAYVSAEAWMINSRDFCRFVITDGYARKMLLTFAYSVEPSEHYFATLLWNHPRYNATIVGRALRHVIWRHGDEVAGQHPFLVDELSDDGTFKFKEVVKTSPNFFIRKFEKANSPLMDFIDGRMEEEEHVKEVYKLYDWATGVAIEENDAKADSASVKSY